VNRNRGKKVIYEPDSTDKGLLTPDNCAVIFIDHQRKCSSALLANIDRQDLLNNVLVLAKAAKIFGAPVILKAVESEEFCGQYYAAILDLFPNQTPIERSSLNAWENKDWRRREEHARNNFLIAASERNVPGVSGAANVGGGYGVYASRTLRAARARPRTTPRFAALSSPVPCRLPLCRCCSNSNANWRAKENYEEVIAVVKEHCGAYVPGHRICATMVKKRGEPKTATSNTKIR